MKNYTSGIITVFCKECGKAEIRFSAILVCLEPTKLHAKCSACNCEYTFEGEEAKAKAGTYYNEGKIYNPVTKTNPKLAELKAMIIGVVESTPAGRTRTKALKACQWRMRGPNGEYVGLTGGARLICSFVSEAQAMILDGRDSYEIKLATFERELGPLSVEIIPQIC